MNNRIVLLSLLIATIVIFSCGDDEKSDIPGIEISGCKLTNMDVTYVLEEGDYREEFDDAVTFVYEDNKLSRVTTRECWNGECETNSYDLTYDGDVISVNAEDSEVMITFSQGKITMFTSTDIYDGEEYLDEYRYTYSGDKVANIENWDNYSGATMGEMVLYSRAELTYTGNNVSRMELHVEEFDNASTRKIYNKKKYNHFSSSARSSALVQTYEASYTFDDKVNPLKGTVAAIFIGQLDFFNANNVATERVSYFTGTGTSVDEDYNVTYEYNSHDLPVRATKENTSGDYLDQVETVYTFDCD